MKNVKAVALATALLVTLAACSSENPENNNTSSHNSQDASSSPQPAKNVAFGEYGDRRIIFFNTITDTYLLSIQGRCRIDGHLLDGYNRGYSVMVTCEIGPDEYKQYSVGLSDNVTYLVDSLPAQELPFKVELRPEAITSDIDIRTSGDS